MRPRIVGSYVVDSIAGSHADDRKFKITLSYDDNMGVRKEKVFICAQGVWCKTFYFYDAPSYKGFIKTTELADNGIKGRSFSYSISPEVNKSTLTIKTKGILFDDDVITLYA